MIDLAQKNKLLFARAGFGISLDDFANPKTIEQSVNDLFPKVKPGRLEMITSEEWAANSPKALKAIADEGMRREQQKTFRQRTKDINMLWVQAMVSSSYPLVEKTALFWHGHFATRLDNPYFDQELLNTFRIEGLGNFGDLLRAVSKSCAMLQFLNNRQNKKEHPNENFAREVMELFTLGRGHYTEDDVKEAARAFTGWNFDEYGNFVFHQKQHDDGEKKFLGRRGNFNGDDILDILLQQKQTAVFITQKVYRYFVSDELTDNKRVTALAGWFYNSNYDIAGLLGQIFTADWFYSAGNAGSKVKSPVELLVGYQRMLPMQFSNEKTIINLQRVLGQYLFNPPNVAGWPGGRYWIDSSSLVMRMRLPEAFFLSKEISLELKEQDAEMPEMHKTMAAAPAGAPKPFKVGKVEADWSNYIAHWQQQPREQLLESIAAYLLPYALSTGQIKQISSFADTDNTTDYIKSITILLMELPEYQLT